MELYQRIIGPAWSSLSDSVQEFHLTGEKIEMRGQGLFNIRHGSNVMAQLLACLMRMPAAGDNVPTELVVTSLNEGERWRRSFAGKTLISDQREQIGNLMLERFGMLELGFNLAVRDQVLHYQQTRAALRVGTLRVSLPGWLAPRIVASERAAADRAGVLVSVEIRAPLLGRLMTYTGCIKREGAAP